MSIPRFLVRDGLAAGARLTLPAEVHHHARRVLRLVPGDALTLFDGRGSEYSAELLSGADNASCSQALVLAGGPLSREARLSITLVQALSALEKMDWLLEKVVELGVARIVLVPTARSVVRLEGDRAQRRVERWQQLAIAACCQCGRTVVPEVALVDDLQSALRKARTPLGDGPGAAHDDRPTEGAAWILDPGAPQPLLGATTAPIQQSTHALCLAVGPEGGFTEAELAQAQAQGYVAARCGPRILRTETAGLTAISALLASAGEYSVPARL